MGINAIKLLKEHRQIVSENVARLLRLQPRFLGRVRAHELEITCPHQWYSMGLTDLAAGKLLSAAKMTTWRFILMRGTDAVGVATASDEITSRGNNIKFGSLFQTCFAKQTLAAICESGKSKRVQKQDYELRFLDAPAVYFISVWLHSKSDDIIVPLPPTYGEIEAYHLYNESDIIDLLKPAIELSLRFAKK
jgi:hypothetical protein